MKKKIDLLGVAPETWARTLFLVLALANQTAAMFGRELGIDLTEDEIYRAVTVLMTVAAALRAWWKNNSFSESAQAADMLMKGLEAQAPEYVSPLRAGSHHRNEVG